MQMNHKVILNTAFLEGDEVELIAGSYPGTLGVFVRFREDVKWADIAERDGSVRRHPVEWLGRPGTRLHREE